MATKKCPVCGTNVKLENLERHVRNQHPRETIDLKEVLSNEELDETRRMARATRPRMTRRGARLLVVASAVLATLLAIAILNPFGNVGPAVGQVAPDFTRPTSTGGSVTLSALRGQPVLLEFMDVDCPACQNEAADVLTFLYDNYSARAHFLSVSANFIGDPDTAQRIEEEFKAPYGTDWTYALDPDKGVTRAYGVGVTPTTFILDASGVVTAVFRGRPAGGYAAYAAALDAAQR